MQHRDNDVLFGNRKCAQRIGETAAAVTKAKRISHDRLGDMNEWKKNAEGEHDREGQRFSNQNFRYIYVVDIICNKCQIYA